MSPWNIEVEFVSRSVSDSAAAMVALDCQVPPPSLPLTPWQCCRVLSLAIADGGSRSAMPAHAGALEVPSSGVRGGV